MVDALPEFMPGRYERCCMVVEHSLQLGEWQLHPRRQAPIPSVSDAKLTNSWRSRFDRTRVLTRCS
jgi:hypothetical protein